MASFDDIASDEMRVLLYKAAQRAKIGFWRWNMGSDAMEWSDEVYAMLGLPVDGMMTGTAFLDRVAPDDRAKVQSEMDNAKAGAPPRRVRFRMRRKNGALIHVEVEIAVSDSASESDRDLMGIVQDITVQVEREQGFVNIMRSMEATKDELRRLLFAASHHIKEPSRLLSIYSEMMLRDLQDKDCAVPDSLTVVKVEADRLLGFVHDLDTYLDALGRAPDATPVNVAVVARDAAVALDDLVQETGAAVHVGECPKVMGDKGRLFTVFKHLIQNALIYRHADRTPDINVAAVRDDEAETVTITITDNGRGVDPAFHDRVFELFERLDASQTDNKGSGIGLGLCRKIVEKHRGTLDLRSQPGEGTTMIMTLPAVPGPLKF